MAVISGRSALYQTLTNSAGLRLRKGDTVSVYVYSQDDADNDWFVQGESSFACVLATTLG